MGLWIRQKGSSYASVIKHLAVPSLKMPLAQRGESEMLENLRHLENFRGDVVLSNCCDWCRVLVAELPLRFVPLLPCCQATSVTLFHLLSCLSPEFEVALLDIQSQQ